MQYRVVTESASPSQPAALVTRLYLWFSKERLFISSLSSETN